MRSRSFVNLAFAVGLLACGGSGTKGSDAPGDDSSGGSDAQVTTDAGIDTPSPPGDAAIGALCFGTVCPVNEVCCIGATSVCRAPALCPSQGFVCDGPEDCPGGQCCYGNGGQGGSLCRTSCANPACHVDADCPAATPKCCPKAFTPMYNVCQTAC